MASPSRLICLLLLLSLLALPNTVGLSTLLLGDSVDRFVVQAWCLDVALTHEKQWGSHTIRYVNKDVAHPAQYCHAPSINASLASVHIYGSAPTGPYFGGFKSSEADLFADTPPRMAKAWELYLKEFSGPPDLVFLHTAQWDLRGLSSLHGNNLSLAANASLVANFTSGFRVHLHDRIQDVLGLIRASTSSGVATRLGLRTAAFSIHVDNSFLQDLLNDVIRETVASHPARLLLFDVDRDLWSREGFARSKEAQSSLFRDFIHPREHFLAAAGSKMLGVEYSRWAFWQQPGEEPYAVATAQTELDRPPAHSLAPLLLRRGFVIRLVQLNASLFLATIVSPCSAQPPVKASFRSLFLLPPAAVDTVTRWLSLGPSETLRLPPDYTLANSSALRVVPLPPLHLLTTGGGNPMAKESGATRGVQTTLGEVFVLSYSAGGLKFGGLRHVAGDLKSVWAVYGIREPQDVLYGFDVVYGLFPRNFDVVDIWSEGTLFRFYKEREVWMSANGTRRSFSTWVAFVSRGFDTDMVKICYEKGDMELLPVGEPLS